MTVTMEERIRQWIQWGARQLGTELPLSATFRSACVWEDAYWALYDIVWDEYSADEAEAIIDRVTMNDIAIMAAGLLLSEEDEGWIDTAVSKLLKRFDRRIEQILKEADPPYFTRFYGDAPEDYHSDAEW
jgi:hypothetical protein